MTATESAASLERDAAAAAADTVSTSAASRRARLVGVIFGSQPDHTSVTRRTAALYVAGFLAAVAYQVLIPNGRSRLTHMWAEDGQVFLSQALDRPFLAALTQPWGGYYHFLPRLVAELAAHLPLSVAPVVFSVSAASLRALVALFAFAAARAYLPAALPRLLLASVAVVLPAANLELVGNMTNLHWITLFGAFWALLWRAERGWQVAIATPFLFFAATSSGLGPVLVPLAAMRFLLPRWRDRIPSIGYFAGVVLQLWAYLDEPRARSVKDAFVFVEFVKASEMRGPLTMLIGPDAVAALGMQFTTYPGFVALLIVLAVIAADVWHASATRRFLILACAGWAVLFLAIELYMNWSVILGVTWPGVVLIVQRYSALPGMLLMSAMIVSLASVPRLYVVKALVTGTVLFSIIYQLAVNTSKSPVGEDVGRLTGPTVQAGIEAARLECALGQHVARVPISPREWVIIVPCEYLR